ELSRTARTSMPPPAELFATAPTSDTGAIRASDAAAFLSFEPLSADRVPWALEALGIQDGSPLAKRIKFRYSALRFFEQTGLLAVEDTSRDGRRELFFLCIPGKSIEQLDWTNAPIYQACQRYEVNLSLDENALQYCRFFFHFVRGNLGSFQI